MSDYAPSAETQYWREEAERWKAQALGWKKLAEDVAKRNRCAVDSVWVITNYGYVYGVYESEETARYALEAAPATCYPPELTEVLRG